MSSNLKAWHLFIRCILFWSMSESNGVGRGMIDPSRSAAWVEYDDAPLRPFHAAVAAASSGGVFSDGYGLGIIGISLSLAAPQLVLSPVWMGLLGGAALFGLFAGALVTGPTADRFGRRPFFAYNMAVLAILSSG